MTYSPHSIRKSPNLRARFSVLRRHLRSHRLYREMETIDLSYCLRHSCFGTDVLTNEVGLSCTVQKRCLRMASKFIFQFQKELMVNVAANINCRPDSLRSQIVTSHCRSHNWLVGPSVKNPDVGSEATCGLSMKIFAL